MCIIGTAPLVARTEEGGTVKKVLRVKKEDLSRILSTRKSPKKIAGAVTDCHWLVYLQCILCVLTSQQKNIVYYAF